MIPKDVQFIIATTLLLSLASPSGCFAPLPCHRYAGVGDVMGEFARAEARHDTRSGSRLRGEEWREAGAASGATGEVAKLLEGENFYRVATPGGFHRKVQSCVNARGAVERECWVMAEEKVPRSLFVDVYAMEREGGGRKYFFPEHIDVEAPEFEASEHSFLAYSRLNTSHPACHASTRVTWHLRYHRPSASGESVRIDLPHPNVYLHCRPSEGETAERVCASRSADTFAAPCPRGGAEVCEWAKVSVGFKGRPRFTVPVGDEWHEVAAVLVTLLVTVGGSFVMMRYLCNDSDDDEFCDGESPYDDAKIHDE